MALLYPTTANFTQKTLSGDLLTGITASATLNNVTSIQNKKGIMIVDRLDSNGNLTPAKVEVIQFNGTSGTTVTSLTRGLAGTTDQDHQVGAIVEFGPDVVWAQSLIDAITQEHDEDGKHDVSAMITGGSVLDEDDMSSNSATKLATQQSIKAYVDSDIKTATDGATVTFDLGNGAYRKHKVTLGGNRTLAISNGIVGQVFIIDLIQDGTGGRTVTWFSTIKWAGGTAPTLTTTANKIDSFGFIVTSAGNYQGYVIGQNL